VAAERARLDIHHYGHPARPGRSAHQCGAAGWGDGHISHARWFAGGAQAGSDDPWVGCCDLGTARAAYGDSGNQHCQLIFGACCSRIARFKSACSSSLAEKGAPPLTPPYHAPGARLPTLTAWSGDYSTAQDHVAWGAQHGEVDTRISIEDHQIGWHPFAEPGRVAEPRASAPGTGPQRIFS
jgi:hypothetical protein